MMAIYRIRNISNQKVYIGSAINVKQRWSMHLSLLHRGLHFSKHLQSAWDLLGENHFSFEVVESVLDKNNLLVREQYWLDFTKCCDNNFGYNSTPVAGSSLGRVLSEHTKGLISKAHIGKKLSRIHRIRIGLASKGISQSLETRLKRSKSLRGRTFSKSHCSNISRSKIGGKMSIKSRAAISKGYIGLKHTEESKLKISKALKGRKFSDDHRHKLSVAIKKFYTKKS